MGNLFIYKYKRVINILILSLASIGLTMGFNACSKVGFQAVSENSLKCETDNPECNNDGQGNPDDGDDNGGGGNDDPPNVVENSFDKLVDEKLDAVDILMVIDNSGSMEKERDELANRLQGFISALDVKGLDWQMCYLTTDVSSNNAGKLLEWRKNNSSTGKTVLLPNTPDKELIFQSSMDHFTNFTGSGNEQGIGSTNFSLDHNQNYSCFRSNAALALIILSDEDEASCGGRCKGTSNQYRELEDYNSPAKLVSKVTQKLGTDKIFTAHSIVIAPGDGQCMIEQSKEAAGFYGEVYAELSQITGGTVGNICSDNYANQLGDIGERIAETLSSFKLECPPINGTLNLTIQNNSTNSTYKVEGDKIIFTPALAENTRISGTYKCYK